MVGWAFLLLLLTGQFWSVQWGALFQKMSKNQWNFLEKGRIHLNLPASALRPGLKCHHPERAEGLFLRGASWDFRSERFSFFHLSSMLQQNHLLRERFSACVHVMLRYLRYLRVKIWSIVGFFFRLFVAFYLFCSSFQTSAFQFLSLKVGLVVVLPKWLLIVFEGLFV